MTKLHKKITHDKKYKHAWVTFSSNNTYKQAVDIKKYYKIARPNNDVRIIKGLDNTYEVQER